MARLPSYQENFKLYMNQYPRLALSGELGDLQVYAHPQGGTYTYLDLAGWLHRTLAGKYETVVFYSPSKGFYNDQDAGNVERFKTMVGCSALGRCFPDAAKSILKACESTPSKRFAVVVTDASRLCASNQTLSAEEADAMAALRRGFSPLGAVERSIVFLLDNARAFPSFMLNDRAHVKSIQISPPDSVQRGQFIRKMLQGKRIADKDVSRMADASYDMRLIEILRILETHKTADPALILRQISLAKNGHRTDPWRELDEDRVKHIPEELSVCVLGQDKVVRQISSMLKGAVRGYGKNRDGGKHPPKAVLMFAGPTGVGKTEMARSIAKVIFGNADQLIKFDMGEYSQPHSMERLAGAPPGYVGYSEGGQLTNAVRANPFSVILFDEIEKAHPEVLNKLLAITDDGRMTDGHGDTVSFENTVIILTTNQGAQSGGAPEEVEERTHAAIRSFFKDRVNRFEMYGRLVGGIMVFMPLDKETAGRIYDKRWDEYRSLMKEEEQISISIDPSISNTLREEAVSLALELGTGGRAVMKQFDILVSDPLVEFLCENSVEPGSSVRITQVRKDAYGVNAFSGSIHRPAPPVELQATGTTGVNIVPAQNRPRGTISIVRRNGGK